MKVILQRLGRANKPNIAFCVPFLYARVYIVLMNILITRDVIDLCLAF